MIIRIRYEGEGSHVRARVFTGTNDAALGLSGSLMIRLEEWPDFKDRMELARVDVRPEHAPLRGGRQS